MIQRHYSLSCFILEHLSKVQYLDYDCEMIDLIDGNNIYSFKLPNAQHYQKIATESKLVQVKHIGSLWFFLDQNHTLIVRKKNQQLYKFEEIEEIIIMQGGASILVLLRQSNFCKASQLYLKIGTVTQSTESEQKDQQITFNHYSLEEQIHEQENFNKYVPNFKGQYLKVEKILGRCCLLVDGCGEREMIQLMLNDFKPSEQKVILFKRIFLPIQEHFEIISIFNHYLLIRIESSIMIINADAEKITNINQIQISSKETDFVVYGNFIIIVLENKLTVYELLKGNKMAEINIDSMLQQFEQGSTLILNKHENNEGERYCILYDFLRSKISHFFLFDKQKLAIYYFNLNKLLERGFIKMIKQNLKGLQSDEQKYHENVIKTINFRMRKLEALEKYIADDFKNNNFGNSIRFLVNQHTPYILSDGLSLFHNAIMVNLSKLLKQKGTVIQLQREIIKLCHRLIVQSSYEIHIANGLQILNSMYTNFRKIENNEGLEKNKEGYTKLLQTSRISKLLKNEKKKKLFELSYELMLKIKGYKYLQSLTSNRVK